MKQRSIFIILTIMWSSFTISSLAAKKSGDKIKNEPGTVWTKEKANVWYSSQTWVSGCNFIPSSAINQIEMWQAETFDPITIDKELGWAQELGFNTMRVYLSSVVWKNDPVGFKRRINKYLDISKKHRIRAIFVFFDDCWNEESAIGKQPDPKPGVHNSGWVQDPSSSLRKDTILLFPVMKNYVIDILTAFKNDKRVLLWDLYNEPANSNYGDSSLPLVKNVFKWARLVNPSQPVSMGIWCHSCTALNTVQIENSDVITYHNYSNENKHKQYIDFLKSNERPMICSEYMARRNDSKFQTIMPMLKNSNIGAINWGFVAGKTNTIFAWDEPLPDAKEPKVWFHDIYRQDKTPFDSLEIKVIKSLNGIK